VIPLLFSARSGPEVLPPQRNFLTGFVPSIYFLLLYYLLCDNGTFLIFFHVFCIYVRGVKSNICMVDGTSLAYVFCLLLCDDGTFFIFSIIFCVHVFLSAW
jgi:hypothetical protein